MLTIQQVGLEVLQHSPRSLYIFGGSEYGIKSKYIDILAEHYGSYKEVENVSTIVELMSSKHLIPLQPALYIVRYDEKFIAGLTAAYATKLIKLQIVGTVVIIYEQAAHLTKCDKFLPNNTVSIDAVDAKFIVKYLSADFPTLPNNVIQLVAKSAANYGHAQKICTGLASLHDVTYLDSLTDYSIRKLFGIDPSYSEQLLKLTIAGRNYAGLVRFIDEYQDNLDAFLYAILATLVELEKLKSNSYVQSNLRAYAGAWTLKDIYNMFNHTYKALQNLRTITSDARIVLSYLISLVVFNEIPDVEVMECI